MNSEFPTSRVPTVVSSNQGSTAATSNKSFQEQIIQIFKNVINSLRTISDTVANWFTRNPTTQNPAQSSQAKKEVKKEREERIGFFKRVSRGFSSLGDAWRRGIDELKYTFESVSSSIGSAIGGVFGSGLFGNLISKIITKALNFAVTKILLGVITAHLPTIAIITAVIGAIAALAYWGEDIYKGIQWIEQQIWKGIQWIGEQIWEGIKWFWDGLKKIGWAIDQAIGDLIDILPWGKSKYTKAKEGLADAAGVDKRAIEKLYGKTIEGRNQMLEDWRKLETDEDFKKELLGKLRSNNLEIHKKDQEAADWILGKPVKQNMSLINEVKQSNLPDYFYNPEEQNMTKIGEDGYAVDNWGNTAITPIISNTTNTALDLPNFFGSNVSMMYPSSSINGDINMNYSPIGQY